MGSSGDGWGIAPVYEAGRGWGRRALARTNTQQEGAAGLEYLRGPMWLPVASQGDKHVEWLQSWEVRAELPEHKGYGHRRHAPPEKALMKQRQRRLTRDLARPGQPETSVRGGLTPTGPTAGGPGHATGPVEDDPWADPLARVRKHLERARAFRGWIDEVPERTAADLARKETLTRARVSQVLKLLDLAPAIVEDIEREDRRGPLPSELQLRRIAAIPDPGHQWSRYEQLVRQGDLSIRGGSKAAVASTRSRGCQGDLERARRLQKLWDTGAYDSLKALGRDEGVTGARVSQLLNLLHLAPEILAVLDVPEEEVPAGITKSELRAIARLRGHDAQRRAFEERWPGVLAGVAAK